MADLYVGDFGRVGEYFVPTTNFEDHKTTFNFDGIKFHKTDDALYVGLHCTSIEGLNKKSTIQFPACVLLKLSTKPYEYEAFDGGQKKKATIEPTNREKLLYAYLTGEDPELNYEKNEGKGGFLAIGASANDAPILAGDGNAKKHARFVIEFDDEIKPFDMSGDNFRLDSLASGNGKGGKGYNSKPAETEAQKIEARKQAVKAVVRGFRAIAVDGNDDEYMTAMIGLADNPKFAVLTCLHLGLPIPSNLGHWTF